MVRGARTPVSSPAGMTGGRFEGERWSGTAREPAFGLLLRPATVMEVGRKVMYHGDH